MEANVWSFLIALAPGILAAGAWCQSWLNHKTGLKNKAIAESSHALINQRFSDLEAINGALREEIAELRSQRDVAAGQAITVLDAAARAREIIEAAAIKAAALIEAKAKLP